MAEILTSPEGRRSSVETSRTEKDTSAKVLGSGSSMGALCGLGAVVLTILGLSGMDPVTLCAIAVLAAGTSLVFAGGAIADRYHQVRLAATMTSGKRGVEEVETGMTVEIVGGIGAVVLGILALIHIAPFVLLPVAAITLGATLLLGSGATYQVSEMPASDINTEHDWQMAHRAASSAAGVDVLIGLGSVALGILGLIGVAGHLNPILSLVALLCVGAAELISGSVIGARMSSVLHHHH